MISPANRALLPPAGWQAVKLPTHSRLLLEGELTCYCCWCSLSGMLAWVVGEKPAADLFNISIGNNNQNQLGCPVGSCSALSTKRLLVTSVLSITSDRVDSDSLKKGFVLQCSSCVGLVEIPQCQLFLTWTSEAFQLKGDNPFIPGKDISQNFTKQLSMWKVREKHNYVGEGESY